MTAPSAILLTTCHLQNDGVADLLRLIASEANALEAGELDRLRHVVLLQGCNSQQREDLRRELPSWVELLASEESMSSPAARNLMIRYLLADEHFSGSAFVGFPDDDAWYPAAALACVGQHFRNMGVELLLCRYGPNAFADGCDHAHRATLQHALSRGACAAIFLRGSLLAQLGGFNELLGLGTRLKGGEDTEFVHRAFQLAGDRIFWVPGTLVGHAAADPVKKALYYEGALAAIMAHSHFSAAARLALFRKLAVGVWLVIRGRMPVSRYLASLRKARANASTIKCGN